ncbi:hypothetical protein [Aneurinibacillus terranovensis]|uniref:hypothetical protein n=1 Tax=Aneurinibacillus terranovensis TaxID=278991 RepID=UPI0004261B3E|nr:hypothetical protein [Aneurinibacillus terranovensis]
MEANHDELKEPHIPALEEETPRKEAEKTAVLTGMLHRYKQHLRELEVDTVNVKTEAEYKTLINQISNAIDKIRILESMLKENNARY